MGFKKRWRKAVTRNSHRRFKTPTPLHGVVDIDPVVNA